MKIIQSDFSNHNQSWSYTQVIEESDKKFRVRIRRNAYDNQSFAVAELWTGTDWNQIISRPIEKMKCHSILYYEPLTARDETIFKQDAEDLLKMAFEVVR